MLDFLPFESGKKKIERGNVGLDTGLSRYEVRSLEVGPLKLDVSPTFSLRNQKRESVCPLG